MKYTAWNIFRAKHPDIETQVYGWKIGPRKYIYPTKLGFTFYYKGYKIGGAYFLYGVTVQQVVMKLEEFYEHGTVRESE